MVRVWTMCGVGIRTVYGKCVDNVRRLNRTVYGTCVDNVRR